jgi:hypothetical protein
VLRLFDATEEARMISQPTPWDSVFRKEALEREAARGAVPPP